MKLKKMMAICMLAVMLTGISACGSQEPAAADGAGTTEADGTDTTTDTEEAEKDQSEAEEQDQQESGPVTIKVFCSNEDATQLIEEAVEIEELSPENILKALVEKEVLPESVGILSLEESEKDGKKALDVDFSQELSDYINSMGSTGEYMIMGGICNTFLGAYECDMIQIRVEGEVLTTGHKEYTGYQTSYAL